MDEQFREVVTLLVCPPGFAKQFWIELTWQFDANHLGSVKTTKHWKSFKWITLYRPIPFRLSQTFMIVTRIRAFVLVLNSNRIQTLIANFINSLTCRRFLNHCWFFFFSLRKMTWLDRPRLQVIHDSSGMSRTLRVEVSIFLNEAFKLIVSKAFPNNTGILLGN